MRFCPNCENLLITKNKKLYCRTCEVYFEMNDDIQKENITVKTIKHDEKDFDPVMIIGNLG